MMAVAVVVTVIVTVTAAAISLHPGIMLRALGLVFSKQAREAAVVCVCTSVMSTHKRRGAEGLARGHKGATQAASTVLHVMCYLPSCCLFSIVLFNCFMIMTSYFLEINMIPIVLIWNESAQLRDLLRGKPLF